MAHERQQEFCKRVKGIFPEYFKGVNVCDIGSLDINGNNHYLFEDEYKPLDGNKYDIVISTECFEHDIHWSKTIENISMNLLKSGGMFLFTCATTGRPEHGTLRSQPTDSPLTSNIGDSWSEYYMNLTEQDIVGSIDLPKYYKVWRFSVDLESHDLYFWGIKH